MQHAESGAGSEFATLLQRVRQGCPEAFRELYERYRDPICRVVRRRLPDQLRSQYDSTDLLQDVWVSFVALPRGQYDFSTPEVFVRFLSGMAAHKVIDARRRSQTGKADRSRERPLPVTPDGEDTLPSPDPTPSQVVMADEWWARLLADQPEKHRPIVELLRLGYSRAEIADRLGLHPKVVQRVVRTLTERYAP